MLRENSRHYHAMLFDTVRRKLLTTEDQLIATGRLRCAEDIFFLEYDELLALTQERLDWTDVEERIRNAVVPTSAAPCGRHPRRRVWIWRPPHPGVTPPTAWRAIVRAPAALKVLRG